MDKATKYFMTLDIKELEKFMHQIEDELKSMKGEEYVNTRMNLQVLKAIYELRTEQN